MEPDKRGGDGGRRENKVESEAAEPPGPKAHRPRGVCLHTFVDEHLPVCLFVFDLCLCVICNGANVFPCEWLELYSALCVCVQTQLWLALQLITRHSQLLITQHLFCPRSLLFCAHYQAGSLHGIRRRALSNTVILESPSSAVFQRTPLLASVQS